jgi:sporulation protein YlmC with PRC-barrel domain
MVMWIFAVSFVLLVLFLLFVIVSKRMSEKTNICFLSCTLSGNILVSVDKLSGKNVIGASGIIIGEVKGAEVNTTSWQITHLQVKLSDQASEDLGFRKRFRSSIVCMPVSLITAVGDVITIGKTLDELSRNPEISDFLT